MHEHYLVTYNRFAVYSASFSSQEAIKEDGMTTIIEYS